MTLLYQSPIMAIRRGQLLHKFAFVIIMALVVSACDLDNAGDSIFDPNFEHPDPNPTVERVEPTVTTLAGVGEVTIFGTNFSTVPEENLVLFDGERATVLEASPERLHVRVPNTTGENLQLRVTRVRSEFYSEARDHNLIPAVVRWGSLIEGLESPRGITMDADGNLFVAIFSGASPGGILRVSPDNEREQFVAPQGWTYVDMAYNPVDGQIYLARGALAVIYRMSPDNGAAPAVFTFQPALGPINRIAADEWGNIWAGGASNNIHRITPLTIATSYPLEGDIRGIDYGQGYVYVSLLRDGSAQLWRAPVDEAGTTGDFQSVLRFDDHPALAGATPGDVVVREDGSVFLGTSRSTANARYALLHVQPDGSWRSFYGTGMGSLPSMLGTMSGLVLGPNNYLYAARQPGPNDVVRIDLQYQEGR
jgi:streptogramin lyase